MNGNHLRRIWLASVLSGLSVLGGCVPYAEVGYTTQVNASPPRPYDEIVPPGPSTEYVWVSGYWWWDGAQWVWIRGRWAYPPGEGYVWVRSGWEYQNGQYVFVHGRWLPPARRIEVQYVHPAPTYRVQVGTTYRHVPPRTTVRTVRRVR